MPDTKASKKSSPPSTVGPPVERGKWGNKLQFVLSCVGYSVGLGNVWRFSYLAFENGGGAFLIPYVIAAVMCGLPLYTLELALGQFGSLGPTSVFRRISPLFQGIGWGVVIVSLNVALYYNLIIAWILYYFFISIRKKLLWTDCNNEWNTWKCSSESDLDDCKKVLNDTGAKYFNHTCFNSSIANDKHLNGMVFINDSASGAVITVNQTIANTLKNYILDMKDIKFGPDDFELGGMNWPVFGFFLMAWALVFACLWGGVQTSGKVVYFTALFPYVVLLIILIRGSLLKGAGEGVKYYIKPQMDKLFASQTWRKAAVQVFYSLGPGQGGLITLASYNEFDNNFIRDATIVTIVDSLTSTLAGFTTFSIIGHVAHLLEVPVANATQSGAGLAFVVFPTAAASIPVGPLWSVLFFFMLITLGLDSEFVLYETVTTAIMDQFPKLQKRKTIIVGVGCVICFLLGIPFCTKGGALLLTIYDDYSSGYVLMLLAVYETVVVCWVYGLGRFLKDIERMCGKMPNWYWRVTWAVVTPVYMVVIFIVTLIDYTESKFGGLTLHYGAQWFGWFLSCMPMLSILGFATYRIAEVFRKKLPWANLVTATAHWCPAMDLIKPSPARHEGSIRMHILDHPRREHPIQSGASEESELKKGSGSVMSNASGLL